MLTLKEANEIAGSLGYPSKMPGTSYGISAFKCKTGGKLAKVPGSVCFNCYAMKGNYIYGSVTKSHKTRLRGISKPGWVEAMVTLLNNSGSVWHRWHDSGDLQSIDHLAKICAVATQTPTIKHWLPTRELKLVQEYAAQNAIPKNLTIRISATMVDGPATKTWPTVSTVHTVKPQENARVCPAPKQNNTCGNCRACWNPNVANVSYHKH